MTMDNRQDPVRAFLESVKEARFEQHRCHRKMLELDAQCQSITAQMSGMPGGGSGDKHRDALWAALSDQREAYRDKYLLAKKREQEVEKFISGLPNPVHRAVLSLHYVDLMTWPYVTKELERCGIYYSERQIFRLHGDALQAARLLWQETTQQKEDLNENRNGETENIEEMENC